MPFKTGLRLDYAGDTPYSYRMQILGFINMSPLRFFLSMTVLTILCSLAAPAQAEGEGTGATAKPAAAAADPALEKLEKRSLELVENLGEEELKHLFHIRESFGSTRAVKVVRSDVQKAVKACGTANSKPAGRRTRI
jgi:hypothetical protein